MSRRLVTWTALAGVLLAATGRAAAGPVEDCSQFADTDRRIAGCTELLQTAPPRDVDLRVFAYQNRSVAHLRKKEFERAIADASRAIRLKPRSVLAWAFRADALRRSGNLELAVAEFTRAIRLSPRDPVLYNNRGLAYRELGALDKAIADYTSAIRLNPNYALALRNRGDAYREREAFKEALADYDAALRIDPTLPNVQDGRAAAEAALGSDHPVDDCIQEADFERRILGCTALLARNATGSDLRFIALHNRSYAYLQRGLFEKAVADATEAIRLKPASAYTYGNRGDAYRRSDRFDEAIADYTKAVTLDPDYATAFNNRGLAYRKKSAFDKAIADFSKALELNPKFAGVYVNRAAVYEAKKDYGRALADYEAALRIESDLPGAVAGLSRVKALIDPPASKPEEPVATAPPETGRLALVIGVDAYRNLRPLKAAVSDATAIAETLRDLRFQVMMEKDLDYKGMSSRLAALEQKIKPGDMVFFFFSGHGVEIGGLNYLLPADVPTAKPGRESEIQDLSFEVNRLIQRFQRKGARTAILVLDACRNDPFARQDDDRSAALETRGLARLEPPEGVFMMYAAAAHQVSYDRLDENDTHPNSVFTRIFIEEIKTPRAKLRDIAKTTQTRVFALAKSVAKLQKPAFYDEVIGEIVLKP